MNEEYFISSCDESGRPLLDKCGFCFRKISRMVFKIHVVKCKRKRGPYDKR